MTFRTVQGGVRPDCSIYPLAPGFYWLRESNGHVTICMIDGAGEAYVTGWDCRLGGPLEIGDRIEVPQ